jgi:hypothetical protein
MITAALIRQQLAEIEATMRSMADDGTLIRHSGPAGDTYELAQGRSIQVSVPPPLDQVRQALRRAQASRGWASAAETAQLSGYNDGREIATSLSYLIECGEAESWRPARTGVLLYRLIG